MDIGRTDLVMRDELGRTIQQKKVSYVVEADIKGFFDHVHHDWLMRMLELRIADRRILRLIRRFLKGGEMPAKIAQSSGRPGSAGRSLESLSVD